MIEALATLGGTIANKIFGDKAADKQAKLQKEFAQSGIQWKVEDAKKSGIHPLYALGANTVSYTPTQVGGGDFAAAGQNIGRAIDATRSNNGKAAALAITAAELQAEGLKLDNEMKRVQLASSMALARQAGSAPGLPSATVMPGFLGLPGQGDTAQIDGPEVNVKKNIAPITPGQPHAELGAHPEIAWYRTPSGGLAPMVPQSLSESFEQDWPSFYQWYYRNKIVPEIAPPDDHVLNPYEFNALAGEWRRRGRKKWIDNKPRYYR